MHLQKHFFLTNYDIRWQSLHYTSIFPIEKFFWDSCSNMQLRVLLQQECCRGNVSHPFVWSIQGMNCAENSLDSWTYPKSCNTTYCGQTDPVHNCTLGIIKLLSENNASLVSEEFNTCTVIVWVWQREKRLHTSANKWSQLAHTQSVVYVWNSTPPY